MSSPPAITRARFGRALGHVQRQSQTNLPNLTLLLGRMALYSAVSKVMAILKPYAQAFEPVSIDEAYLEIDPSQSASLIARHSPAHRARGGHHRFGRRGANGFSQNCLGLAKAQQPNRDSPARHCRLYALPAFGQDSRYWPCAAKRLARYQLFTCQDVQNWALFDLVRTFGRTGALLFERAQGIDRSPVCSDYERKSLSVEHTFCRI